MEKQDIIKDMEDQDEKLTEEKDYSFISDTNITQYKADLGFKIRSVAIRDT